MRVFNELKTRGCQDILIAVVDGLLQAASHPWGSVRVLLPLLGGLALLALMFWIEARSESPLIPL